MCLFMTDTERGRDPGRGRSRLPAGSSMQDSIPGPQGHAPSRRQALNRRATQRPFKIGPRERSAQHQTLRAGAHARLPGAQPVGAPETALTGPGTASAPSRAHEGPRHHPSRHRASPRLPLGLLSGSLPPGLPLLLLEPLLLLARQIWGQAHGGGQESGWTVKQR